MILSTFVVAVGYAGTYQSTNGNAISRAAGLLFGTSLSYSSNWAGYAVTSSAKSVSVVTASFVVPDPALSSSSGHANSVNLQYKPGGGGGHGPPGGGGGSSSTSYAAFWAGMDGYNSNTVEQAGILMNVSSSGATTYAAWTEFYPAAPTYAPASFSSAIAKGQIITVTVAYSGTSITAKVTDGQYSYSNSAPASGYQRSSAEWIAEAPASGHSILPLADFGVVEFGGHYTTSSVTNTATINGQTGGIGTLSNTYSAYQINMVNRHGALKASTSALYAGDDTSFTVTWESS